MLKILGDLNAPELVSKFQWACGVKPAVKDQHNHNTPAVSNGTPLACRGAPLNGCNGTNGHVNGRTNGNTNGHIYSNGTTNGISTEITTELKLRGGTKNGTTGSGVSNGGVVDKTGSTNGIHKNGYTNGVSKITNETNIDSKDKEGYQITYRFLHILFHFGACLGNEEFYITFYPFLIWNVDGFIGRRLCVFWALFMYLGQATKDIIKWPRPFSPPVYRLEKRYALEYGMPSTHAMVGAGMPFCLLYLTTERYYIESLPGGLFWPGLVIAITWCTLVCFSRIYLGMHSFLDILAGLLYVSLLMPPYFWAVEALDNWLTTSPWAPLVIVLVPLFALVNYPKLDRWSTARGDTTLIVGTATGVMIGYWCSNQMGLIAAGPPGPYPVSVPTLQGTGVATVRLVLGAIILLLTRLIIKLLSMVTVCRLLGLDRHDPLTKQSLAVELPTKFISYITIALVCVAAGPQLFIHLGIERPSYFFEM